MAARQRIRAAMEGSLSHLPVLFLRSRGRVIVRGAAGSIMDHDVFAGVVDEVIVVEAQAMAGGRIQPVRRGVGVMVACDHAVQRLIAKVGVHLELEARHVRDRVSLVVDVEAERRLVRGCVRALFARTVSSNRGKLTE